MGTRDPALWGFFGVVITSLAAILIEQIRSRRKTEDVKQEVLNTKDSADTQLISLAGDVKDIGRRLDDHIRWHIERDTGRYVYLQPRNGER